MDGVVYGGVVMISRLDMYRHLTAYAPLKQVIAGGNFATDSNSDGLADNFYIGKATPISCSGNTQTFIATQTNGEIMSKFNPLALHRYYITAYVKAFSSNVKLTITYNGSMQKVIAHNGDGSYHVLSTVVDMIANGAILIQDWGSSNWQNISVQNFMAFDMGVDSTNPFFGKAVDKMLSIVQKYGYWEGYKDVDI